MVIFQKMVVLQFGVFIELNIIEHSPTRITIIFLKYILSTHNINKVKKSIASDTGSKTAHNWSNG